MTTKLPQHLNDPPPNDPTTNHWRDEAINIIVLFQIAFEFSPNIYIFKTLSSKVSCLWVLDIHLYSYFIWDAKLNNGSEL